MFKTPKAAKAFEIARLMRDNAKPVRLEMDDVAARLIKQENARRFEAFAAAVNTKGLWDF
jgi:hypothetical protein